MNLALPLDHGSEGQYVNWRHALSESEDPLNKSYVIDVLDAKRRGTALNDLVFGFGIAVFVVIMMASLQSPPARRGRGRAW